MNTPRSFLIVLVVVLLIPAAAVAGHKTPPPPDLQVQINALAARVSILEGQVSTLQTTTCPPDSVRAGAICIDKYEASVWKVPPTQTTLIGKIQGGTVKLTDLTSAEGAAAGVIHLGLASGDLVAAGCPDTGNGCVDFHAVSIAGVTPSAFVTWFQAAATARNTRKRLPTNQEWQVAALGTPDDTRCNVDEYSLKVTNTGSLLGCVSDVGAFDMVGNIYEWVADWVPRSTACVPSLFGTNDQNCLAGASTASGPGALLRGGGIYDNGPLAGVFAIEGSVIPSYTDAQIGFRAVR